MSVSELHTVISASVLDTQGYSHVSVSVTLAARRAPVFQALEEVALSVLKVQEDACICELYALAVFIMPVLQAQEELEPSIN
jgi:hypothetical protein